MILIKARREWKLVSVCVYVSLMHEKKSFLIFVSLFFIVIIFTSLISIKSVLFSLNMSMLLLSKLNTQNDSKHKAKKSFVYIWYGKLILFQFCSVILIMRWIEFYFICFLTFLLLVVKSIISSETFAICEWNREISWVYYSLKIVKHDVVNLWKNHLDTDNSHINEIMLINNV